MVRQSFKFPLHFKPPDSFFETALQQKLGYACKDVRHYAYAAEDEEDGEIPARGAERMGFSVADGGQRNYRHIKAVEEAPALY